MLFLFYYFYHLYSPLPKTCNEKRGPWSGFRVTCACPISDVPVVPNALPNNQAPVEDAICEGPPENVVSWANGWVTGGNEDTHGRWGATCTCPDGSMYEVGDNNDNCESMGCVGGVVGMCTKREGIWSHESVVCACPKENQTLPFAKEPEYICVGPPDENAVMELDPNAGRFGGTCTCPDGSVYGVGDNQDALVVRPAIGICFYITICIALQPIQILSCLWV